MSKCTENQKKWARQYYWANRELILAQKKKEREEETDKIKERKKQYYIKNRELILSKKKTYYERNRTVISDRKKAHYDKDKSAIQNARWRSENGHKIKQYLEKTKSQRNAYRRFKHQTDPAFRLSRNLHHLVYFSLKGKKDGYHWESLLGYSLQALKLHLENLFKPGMCWNNYSYRGWHIDHKVPISAFSFESPDDPEFKKCWALENLQPLWGRENISKGGIRRK